MTLPNSQTLEISEALDYYCRVREITEEKRMTIEVFKTEAGGKRYFIHFKDVVALKIPRSWIGPIFDKISGNELIEIARSLNNERLRILSDEELNEQYCLYKLRQSEVQKNRESMYILAGEAFVEEWIRKVKKGN